MYKGQDWGIMSSGRNNSTHTSTLQQPVRSHRGGYLRCPFSIQSDLAAMAERHAGSAFHSNNKARAIRRTETAQSNYTQRREGEEDDSDDNGRPWSRAGVGAHTLTAKERRAQQEEAERIYGLNNNNNNNNTEEYINTNTIGDGNSGVSAMSASHTSASDGLPVALAAWEKSALQRVVPRGAHRRNGKHMEVSENKRDEKGVGFRSKERQTNKDEQEDVQDTKYASNKRKRDNNNNNNNNNNNKGHGISTAVQTQRKSCEDEREQKVQKREDNESTTPKTIVEQPRQEIKKPMNKLQRFDEMRNAALFGKKKGSKR
ncbi:uncharacterized protein TM35_000073550 [Trypanosoma theileri]|uniref:Uncharacterized protein n=1 Tax=Trypanosoma theileri TaxID=67003 RepID=A0A1X0P252_9TRYP|nr:uncharacterized protein TM35_000073550 [Trypanosoma theileri]ORC90931.1 hypothetical protein TM35_000073550 [Trypanosoma theileri]